MTQSRIHRNVIRIRAEDSPNVKLALAQKAAGLDPTGEEIVPGVLPWSEYVIRRALWDEIRQCIGLDGLFYKGPEILLYPPLWMTRAAEFERVKLCRSSPTEGIGIDPGEGGDETAWSAVNKWGLKEQISKKTPDTNVIPRETIAFMHKHKCPAEKVCFDRGGGGKQVADRLRARGYQVRTVAFGEPILLDLKRAKRMFAERLENREERYVYFNRRAEMYGDLSVLMDPTERGFAIPYEYTELRRQMSLIPKLYDPEGRLKMLPKDKKNPDSKEKTLKELLKCSPDELDSLVVAIHAMTSKPVRSQAGIG